MVEPGANNVTRERWRELNKRYEAGSLSKSEYCRKEGISPNTLDYWRTAFKRESEGRPNERARKKKASVGSNENTLVPVRVACQPDQEQPTLIVEIRTDDGIEIRIPSICGAEVIGEVVARLRLKC